MAGLDMPGADASFEARGGWMVRRLAAELGLTSDQAAGLVGNLGYESAGLKTLQEIAPLVAGSRGGYGWAQWTGPRRRKFEAWCAERRLAPASDEANYGFLLHELRGEYAGFLARLRRCSTLAEACRLTHKEYETPADVLEGSYRSGSARLKYAERALAGGAAAHPPLAGEGGSSPAGYDRYRCAKAMQAALMQAGFDPGPIDGRWGARSRAAYDRFDPR